MHLSVDAADGGQLKITEPAPVNKLAVTAAHTAAVIVICFIGLLNSAMLPTIMLLAAVHLGAYFAKRALGRRTVYSRSEELTYAAEQSLHLMDETDVQTVVSACPEQSLKVLRLESKADALNRSANRQGMRGSFHDQQDLIVERDRIAQQASELLEELVEEAQAGAEPLLV